MAKGTLKIDEFLGVNVTDHPRNIPDNKLALSRNMYSPDKSCRTIASRKNTKKLNFYLNVLSETNNVGLKFFQFTDSTGKRHLLLWAESAGAPATGGTLFKVFITGDGSMLIAGLANYKLGTTRRKPDSIVWQSKLYLFPGSGASAPGFVLVAREPGDFTTVIAEVTVKTLGDAWTDKVKAAVAAEYLNTFCLADIDGQDGALIRFCEVLNPDEILPADKSLLIGRGDDDRVSAMRGVTLLGGAQVADPYLVVWKKNSTWLVQGVPPTTTSLGTLKATRILPTDGMVTKETLADTEHGLVWCSGQNVWLMPNGQGPISIGDDIKGMLKRQAQNSALWSGVYFDGIYRLTVPDGSLSRNIVNADYKGVPVQHWYCDLRDYPNKVTWWGPMTFASQASIVEEVETGTKRLIHAFNWLKPASRNVETYFAEGDVDGVDFTDAETGLPDDAGKLMDMPLIEARLKEFTFEDANLSKIFEACELNVRSESAEDVLKFEMVLDGGGQLSKDGQRYDGSGTPEVNNFGFVLGAGVLATNTLARSFQAVPVFAANGERVVAKTFQPVIGTQAGGPDSAGRKLEIASVFIRVRPLGRRP